MAVVVLALITPMIAAFVPFLVFLCVRRAANKKQEPPRPTIEMKSYVNRSDLQRPTSLDAASYVAPSFMDESGDATDIDHKDTIRISIAEEDDSKDRAHVNVIYGSTAAASSPSAREGLKIAETDVDEEEEEEALSSFYDLAEEAAAGATIASSEPGLPVYGDIGADEVTLPARMPGGDEKKTPAPTLHSHRARAAFASTSSDGAHDSTEGTGTRSGGERRSGQGDGDGDRHSSGSGGGGGGGGRARTESVMSEGSGVGDGGRSTAREEDAAMMNKPLRAGMVDEDGFTIRATPSPRASASSSSSRRRDNFYSDSDAEDTDEEQERTRKLRSISIREPSSSAAASIADVHEGIQNLSQTLGPVPSTRSIRAKSAPIRALDPFGDISMVNESPTPGSRAGAGVPDPFSASTPLATPAQGRAAKRVTRPSTLATMQASTPQAPGASRSVFANNTKEYENGVASDGFSSQQQQQKGKRKGENGMKDPFAVEAIATQDPFSVGGAKEDSGPVVLGFGDDGDDGDDDGREEEKKEEENDMGTGEGPEHRKVDFVDVRKLKYLPTPLEEVPREVLAAAKGRLRTLGLKLWLLPYTDDRGGAHIPASLVDEFTTALSADRHAVAAALERLRVTAYNKKVLSLQRKASMMNPVTNTQA